MVIILLLGCQGFEIMSRAPTKNSTRIEHLSNVIHKKTPNFLFSLRSRDHYLITQLYYHFTTESCWSKMQLTSV